MKAVFAYEHELTRGALLIDNKAVFVCGDANAHEIRLTLKNNGVNAQLEGVGLPGILRIEQQGDSVFQRRRALREMW